MTAVRAWSGDPADLLTLLDRAYDLDVPEPRWLQGIVEASDPMLGAGHGVAAFLADADARIHTSCGVGEFERWRQAWFAQLLPLPRPMMRRALDLTPVAYGVDRRGAVLNGHATLEAAIEADARGEPGAGGSARRGVWGGDRAKPNATPFPDSLDVTGLDASGEAVVLLGVRREVSKRPLGARESAFLGRVAGHLASALRLRRARTSRRTLLDGSAPVFDHAGRSVHATDARTKVAVAALRAAVKAHVLGRSKRMPPSEVLEHWRALVLGEYSLLDVFDTDGRRFVVARPNVPVSRPIEGAELLTPGERVVLGQLAGGASNKLIAYELGISTSTVAARLASAAGKLGTRTSAELVQRARGITPTSHS